MNAFIRGNDDDDDDDDGQMTTTTFDMSSRFDQTGFNKLLTPFLCQFSFSFSHMGCF